jgi:general secretion pathway protein M
MKAFQNLTLREQVMVSGGGAILLVLGLWFYVWQPVAAEQRLQSERIARYLSILDIARTAQDGAPRQAVAVVNRTPLAPRITQSAEAAGIPLSRLDPEGARLRVTVAKVGYAEATGWIADLEATSGVRALSIDMARLTEPAQVSLRMTLEDAQ